MTEERERRLAIIEFDPDVLAGLIGRGSPKGIIVDREIPDLRIVAVRDGPPWIGRIEVLCYSASFDVVPDGLVPPIICPTYTKEWTP